MGWTLHGKDGPAVSALYGPRSTSSLYRNSMHEFNQSLRYDKRMHAADIRGSIAYAKALSKVNILTADELQKIVTGLQTVGKEWEDGVVCWPRSSNTYTR